MEQFHRHPSVNRIQTILPIIILHIKNFAEICSLFGLDHHMTVGKKHYVLMRPEKRNIIFQGFGTTRFFLTSGKFSPVCTKIWLCKNKYTYSTNITHCLSFIFACLNE